MARAVFTKRRELGAGRDTGLRCEVVNALRLALPAPQSEAEAGRRDPEVAMGILVEVKDIRVLGIIAGAAQEPGTRARELVDAFHGGGRVNTPPPGGPPPPRAAPHRRLSEAPPPDRG